jgi:hypothetical protein
MTATKAVRIENWAVQFDLPVDQHLLPEYLPRHLVGNAYGHPSFKEGEMIETGTLISSSDREVSTQNTTYVLGAPASYYIEYLAQNGLPPLDEREPLKIRRKCPGCGSAQCCDSSFCDQCGRRLKGQLRSLLGEEELLEG